MLRIVFSILLFLSPILTFGADFVAGKDYEIIENNASLDVGNNVASITEFFSFGCPWCYRIEDTLNQWVESQGKNVYYKKIPVVFNKDWEYYAKAYYTANALSLSSKLNPALFKAILVDKQPLNSNDAMISFLKLHGVDETTAQSAFVHSPSIDMQMSAGLSLMTLYHINTVPAVVVSHRYKTDLQMAKTKERMLEILNFLLAESKKTESKANVAHS